MGVGDSFDTVPLRPLLHTFHTPPYSSTKRALFVTARAPSMQCMGFYYPTYKNYSGRCSVSWRGGGGGQEGQAVCPFSDHKPSGPLIRESSKIYMPTIECNQLHQARLRVLFTLGSGLGTAFFSVRYVPFFSVL